VGGWEAGERSVTERRCGRRYGVVGGGGGDGMSDFYPVRSGRGVKGLSNLMRIKRHCVECSGKIKAVSDCNAIECPFGVTP